MAEGCTLAPRFLLGVACTASEAAWRRGARVQLWQSSKSRMAASPGGWLSKRLSQVQGISERSSFSCRAIAPNW